MNVGVDSTPQSTPGGQRFLVEVSQVQRAARTSICDVPNWPVLLTTTVGQLTTTVGQVRDFREDAKWMIRQDATC
jgi:hypothetical protein